MDPDPASRTASSAPTRELTRPRATAERVRPDPGWTRAARDEEMLIRAVERTLLAASASRLAGEIAIVLADDATVRQLNGTWRGRDEPTNVLAFPLRASGAGGEAPVALGDVVLARETVAREAAAKGVPMLHHAVHLTVHGVLHLLGFTHDGDKDAGAMEALESRVMRGLGLADPYAAETAEAPA